MTKVDKTLFPAVSCFCFNGDRSKIAICANDSKVLIYDTCGAPEDSLKWKETGQELLEHDLLVTSIDWSPNSGRILTCSEDQNAYVWTEGEEEYTENGETKTRTVWNQKLVVLKTNRGAACCKWSPDEELFAVGTAASELGICSYDDENNWWSAKNIKKFKSTVLTTAWHPTRPDEIVAGGSDSRVRVFYASKVKKKGAPKFQAIGQRDTCNGWIHDIQFSPSGSHFAVATQASTVNIYEYAPNFEKDSTNEEADKQTVLLPTMPLQRLLFVNETTIIGVGHEYSPVVIQKDGDQWVYKGRSDRGQYTEEKKTSSVRSAFNKFGANRTKASSGAGIAKTRHKAAVNSIQAVKMDDSRNIETFVTSGMDGKFCFWEVEKCVSDCE